jgi:hypothetical protein
MSLSLRWFVVCEADGEVLDGPYQKKYMAERARFRAEKDYKGKYRLEQKTISPIADEPVEDDESRLFIRGENGPDNPDADYD